MKELDYVFFSHYLFADQYHEGRGYIYDLLPDGRIVVAVEDILADDGSWRISLSRNELLGTVNASHDLLIAAYQACLAFHPAQAWVEISSLAEAAVEIIGGNRKKVLRYVRVALQTCSPPFEYGAHLIITPARKLWDNGKLLNGGITRGSRNYKCVKMIRANMGLESEEGS